LLGAEWIKLSGKRGKLSETRASWGDQGLKLGLTFCEKCGILAYNRKGVSGAMAKADIIDTGILVAIILIAYWCIS
jgi:hypothetical protein